MPLFKIREGSASNSCSGIFTLAFFAFSSLAPSSVEPFSPQRTLNEDWKWKLSLATRGEMHLFKILLLRMILAMDKTQGMFKCE